MKKPIAALFLAALVPLAPAAQPNILFIFIDDIGWGDMSCYGSPVKDKSNVPITPNLDQLAAEGIRFTDGYVASPICSPSRVGVLTGMNPARHAIYSFLNNKAANASRNMNDWLQPDTTTSARLFRDHGYMTGQFGKWHMGGGRDVNNAPFPQEYGFQSSLVSFEGMGDRVLYNGDGLSNQNADVPGTITWTDWQNGADLHTDAAIAFINAAHAAGKPFYVHVPYNDTHSPYNVDPGHENDFDHIASVATNTTGKNFLEELNELDKEIGRLIDTIDNLGISGETLIVVVGDNGAPDDNINALLNRNGGLRGGKGALSEGGIREPFLIRMPGTVPAGVVNSTTAVSTLDLLPTYCALAGIPLPAAPFAGENMSDVFTGSSRARQRPLFWEYGTVSALSSPAPKLAIREGNLKFMRDPDGGRREFFDLSSDRNETTNLVANPAHAATVAAMEAKLVRWYEEVVLGEVGETYVCDPPSGPEVLISDSYDLPGGSSAGSGFGSGTGVNEGVASRQGGALAGALGYVQTDSNKAASAHSISGNRLTVAKAAGSTAFQLSDDGTGPRDFGNELRGRRYEWRVSLDLDDTDISAARMTLGISDTALPAGGVNGHDLGIQLDLVTGNTVSVFKRISAASHSGTGGINASIRTGLPAGEPVDVRVVMDDSTDYTGFNTSYEVFINGTSADTGNISFAGDSRYLVFDTAPNTGPSSYENFAIETLDVGPERLCRIPEVGISEFTPAAVSGVEKVRLYWTTQPGQTVEPVISSDLNSWQPLLDGGVPVQVGTEHGTIRWFEATIPAEFKERSFIQLQTVD
ncbi:sulfatase family protein [Luteolibacter marinus]|uniref:sulfatase family protein n=1 Tax=Luteolibacter marinus TaxID=2776705 RepID=UPI0018690104|nr:sulfatase-like hydrolase/transferase [Luteolibacter marinus]